jgi:hypothetical protein
MVMVTLQNQKKHFMIKKLLIWSILRGAQFESEARVTRGESEARETHRNIYLP